MTRKNKSNVDMGNKHNLEFDSGHKKWIVISLIDVVQKAKPLWSLGCVLNASKAEFLYLLAE